ncbi:MAG: hypothetical protein IKM33_04570, partial [Clostridia bacterium]|nr:hypothetical protein [Clostridia bacterium]
MSNETCGFRAQDRNIFSMINWDLSGSWEMQNAKCKMDEAFCSAKASLMVTCGNLHPKNSFSHEGYLLFA